MIDALAGANEGEVAAVLAAAGVPARRQSLAPVIRRTPLLSLEGSSHIHSEVEWA
jgi:hypothetical protein